DRLGAAVLVPDDPRFPPLLSEIPEPPALLYVWGDVARLRRPAVGIVGSRDHTPYGADAARALAAGVARAGVVVTSGMARGIDHQRLRARSGPHRARRTWSHHEPHLARLQPSHSAGRQTGALGRGYPGRVGVARRGRRRAGGPGRQGPAQSTSRSERPAALAL